MFLKPFRVKRQNTLKGSDKKKIKNDIGKLYRIEENVLSELFPAKGDMSVAKVELHSGEIANIYSCQKNPIFFEINKKWFPSVYALWKAPEMLPVFTTWPPVFTKLAVGADLMLPGVVVSGQVHMGTFRGIKKGDIASIKLVGNRSPMAVGETLLSGEDMYLSAMKGKGVKPLHMMGDLLWEMGDQSVPPFLKDDLDIDVEDSDEEGETSKVKKSTEINSQSAGLSMETLSIDNDNNETEGATANISQSEEESEESSEEEEDPKEAMDELLNYCCLCALKGKMKKSDLPLSTGIFFKNFLQPYCPEDKYIDIKKSSYKKLSKFLQTIEAKGILKVKTLSKGMDSIVEFDKTHEELKDLEVPEIVIPTSTSSNEDEFQSPTIADVFCIPANLLYFFKPRKYSKGQGITADEVRQGLTDYVKTNDLQLSEDKSLIKLDPILAEIVLRKTECDVVTMKWDLAKARLFEKMQPGFQITFPGKPPIIKKGKIDPIKIDVVQRMGNKKVTLIDNVETFGIDPDKFAHLIQVKRACSTTVSPSIQKNKGLQILAQGNQVDFIRQLLIEKYKLPLRFVEGLEKGSNKKKKKR
ncbi:hypothetical protein LOTGIDRAFT_233056 [Lottia gigantea]|uniref:SUI1 domain-containing protein n=1 Tax=Lottia gigantea TaxID=225164 RepID=V3ZML0_LOTGI|nr:hypothetical protein LOTGIDRAFT_233056 [Lottia gigantea]ESO92608.1 hypothetical protein LOTGIDRAFT_233056 [Lottia gigantea]